MLLNNQNDVTLFIRIPNISKLFIYRDNWSESTIMRPVISELLRAGQFEMLHLGNNPQPVVSKNVGNCLDCAYICVTINDMDVADKSTSELLDLFMEELTMRKNKFAFESNMIDPAKNVTQINIQIKVHSRRDHNFESQAA